MVATVLARRMRMNGIRDVMQPTRRRRVTQPMQPIGSLDVDFGIVT